MKAVGIFLALLALGQTGCAAAATAATVGCQVVHALDEACVLITFVAADGTTHTVPCTGKEMAAYGQQVETARIAAAANVGAVPAGAVPAGAVPAPKRP